MIKNGGFSGELEGFLKITVLLGNVKLRDNRQFLLLQEEKTGTLETKPM